MKNNWNKFYIITLHSKTFFKIYSGFCGGSVGKESAMQETLVPYLGQEDPLEKEMATHSSTLAWRIPWTEEACQATVHGVTKESDTA